MLLAKKDWFERRKYAWWWLHPKKRQWWVYVFLMVAVLIVLQSLPFWDQIQRIYITVWWILLLAVDALPIMFTVERDEREHKIEAIAERNAAWSMSFVITIWIVYEIIKGWLSWEIQVDLFLILAILAWVLAKSISNFILDKRWE